MSLRFTFPRRLRALLRFALLGLALPCVYWGGAGAAFFYRYRAGNALAGAHHFSQAALPNARTRLMVFAPHCDDETLGCAGQIQRTQEQGGRVRVVILTNGDAFRTAVERQERRMQVGPADYIAFAGLRQQETFHALANLGLQPKDIAFLGFPDRGLMALWSSNWTPNHLYTSAYTGENHSPYANTYDRNARYCGADLLQEIKANLRAFRPTLITVTHPAEDHPDHGAAAAFVTLALDQLKNDPQEAPWARNCHLAYYLIHRGDWPTPQGARLTDPLLPPAPMTLTDTRWRMFPLTPAEVARKAGSIEAYPSQTSIMGSFLRAFARTDELLGELRPQPLPLVSDQGSEKTNYRQDWTGVPPVLLDPIRDSVLRDLQGGGDIRALYACRDRRQLYIRIDTRQPISARFRYTVHLRVFDTKGKTGTSEPTYILQTEDEQTTGNRIAAHVQGRTLEASIPLKELTMALPPAALIHTLAISADTHLAGVEIDKTGVRFLNW